MPFKSAAIAMTAVRNCRVHRTRRAAAMCWITRRTVYDFRGTPQRPLSFRTIIHVTPNAIVRLGPLVYPPTDPSFPSTARGVRKWLGIFGRVRTSKYINTFFYATRSRSVSTPPSPICFLSSERRRGEWFVVQIIFHFIPETFPFYTWKRSELFVFLCFFQS